MRHHVEPLEPRMMLSAAWETPALLASPAAAEIAPLQAPAGADTARVTSLAMTTLVAVHPQGYLTTDHVGLMSDGDLIVAGYANVPTDFDGGGFDTVINQPLGDSGGFIARIDASGQGEWINFIDDPIRDLVVVDDVIWLHYDGTVYGPGPKLSQVSGNGSIGAELPLSRVVEEGEIVPNYSIGAIADTLHFDSQTAYAAGTISINEDPQYLNLHSYLGVVRISGGRVEEVAKFDYEKRDAPSVTTGHVEVIGQRILRVSNKFNPDIGFIGADDRYEVLVYSRTGWATHGPYTGVARDVTQDRFGNLIVAGEVVDEYGTADKAFVAKLNSNGELIWHREIDGSTAIDRAERVTTDPNGNIVISGFAKSYNWPFLNAHNTDTPWSGFNFVASFSPDGELLWNTGVGQRGGIEPGSAEPSGIAADANGNIAWAWADQSVVMPDIGAARITLVDAPEGPSATLAWPPVDAFVGTQELNDNAYIEVDFDNTDVTTIDGDEIAFAGDGAGTIDVASIERVDDDTFRYVLDGLFELGPVTVNFVENAFLSEAGEPSTAGAAAFSSIPKLDPLHVAPAGGEWTYDEPSKTYRAMGVTTFGGKPGPGEAFTPVLSVDGTVTVSATHISGAGVTTSMTGGASGALPLFAGEFDIPIGQAETSLLLDQTQADLGGLAVASLDVNTFSKMAIVTPAGAPAADTELQLQAKVKLPDDLGGVELSLADPHRIVLGPTGVSITGGLISFPDVEFNLLGLLPAKAEAMQIEYIAAATPPAPAPPQPEALRIRGKLSLPDVWNLTADFSKNEDAGQDNYIEIAAGDPLPVINVVGTMSLEKLVLVPELWEIDEAKLTLDTVNKKVQGDAKITVPPGIEIIGGLGFLDGQLNYVRFGLEGFNSPIGATGAFLQKIAGDVTNIAPAATDPVLFGGDLGLTAGPKVYADLPDWAGGELEGALVELDIRGEIDENHLAGNGSLKMVGGVLTGTGKSDLSWEKGTLTGQVTVKALADALQATAKLKADSDLNLSMTGKGTLTIPEQVPVWGKTEIGSANMLLHFTNDDDKANDLLAGWGETSISVFNSTMKIVAGLRVNLDGSWQLLGARRVAQLPSPFSAPAYAGTMLADVAAAPSPGVAIEPGAQWLLLTAAWENESDAASLVVTGPDGAVYDEATIAAHADMEIVEELGGRTSRTVIVRQPTGGTWALDVASPDELGEITYDAYVDAPPTSAEIRELTFDVASRTVSIDYDAIGSEAAAVHLYYDDDDEGEDGLLIAADLAAGADPGALTWDASAVPDGAYYVYAVVVDDAGVPVVAYSEAPIDIVSTPPTVDVPFGDDSAKSVSYFDADGTFVTVQLKGGRGVIRFAGENIDPIDTGKQVYVFGDDLIVESFDVTDADGANVSVKLKGGDDRAQWNGINIDGDVKALKASDLDVHGDIVIDGDVKALKAKDVDVHGNIVVNGELGKADFGQLIGPATVTLGGDPAGKGVKLSVERAVDVSLDSAAPINSLKADDWLDAEGDPDALRAPWFGSVKIGATLEAGLVATDAAAAKGGLKSLKVGGWIDGAAIVSPASVGSITAAGMRASRVLVGAEPGLAGLPDATFDFADTSVELKKLEITGKVDDDGMSFVDSVVAAWSFKKVSLGAVKLDNGGSAMGVASGELGKLDCTVLGEKWKSPKRSTPGVLLSEGDFVYRIVF